MNRNHLQNLFRSILRTTATMVVLLASVFMLNAANAQLSGKGAISGTVSDPTGAVIPGATVTITSANTGNATTTTSTSSGDYVVSTLDPGKYTVTVSASGFEKLTQENVNINALETQTFNPKLTIGSSTEVITVSTAPPQLETTNATLGATMENEVYSALPIEMGAYGQPDQRRATDFAFLMPGVQGNNTSGNPTTNTGIVGGSGDKGAVSDVYIDGVAFVRAGGNGDPRYIWTAISVDAVDQFQLQTSGYSAVYEGQGIQNYTIKQGGSQYHGGVYEFFRNTALDTWGFFGANIINPATGKAIKPIENSNEYGINLSGPLLPFGSWKDKLFAFGNYNGFRYASENPTSLTFPNLAEQGGNFQGVLTTNLTSPSVGIFDPSTETACASHNTAGAPCRYRYGYVYGGTAGANGGAILGPGGTSAVDVIPASQFSPVALSMQSFLPTLSNQLTNNNYNAPNKTGLVNWSTTDRIDYIMSKKDTITLLMALGRQASSNPVGQTTAGRNVGPVPYNYGQAYAPKTQVGVIEETHIFTPHLVNQLKYGFARYNGPTFNSDELPAYAASTMGITGLPSGAAQNAFPITTFAGTAAPTQWAGTSPSVITAENYTLVDNLQYVIGRHSITVGGQYAWLLYNSLSATGGTTDLTLATAATETEGLNNAFSAITGTGLSYASFLIGQIDKGSLTQYVVQEYGARFHAISPYVQDNWKVSSKLTLDLGLRYDFFPAYQEAHDNMSYFNPNLANPITGINGALEYTGTGAGTCNCHTPVKDYFKNFGPRIGAAYQLDSKTVLRASYGVMFTHGNGVGGGASSVTGTGTLGFSAAPAASANGSLISTMPLSSATFGLSPGAHAFPAFTAASGRASGPAYGTSYTTTTGYTTATPSSMGYADTYLGGRAPEFINYTLGLQHQWSSNFVSTISYVGTQGHFLPTDGGNPRGYWSNQLDPQYLSLGTALASTGAAIATNCTLHSLPCPAGFNTGQALSTALKPFPFQGVSDTFGNVGNENYNALQAQVNMRENHGVTLMASYVWSRTIDDGGTFRSGYAIPAAYSNNGKSWAADRIERTVSLTNQPQHVVVTAVWALPIGKSVLGKSAWERAIFGGYKLSEVYQAYSGSPLAIIGASCPANPAQVVCMPSYNPSFSGSAKINGSWGKGVTRTNYNNTAQASSFFINPAAFSYASAYTFGNLPRTGAYNISGPGNYQLDLALVRSFALHLTPASRFEFRAEMYNVSNHTQFTVATSTWSTATTSNFGQVSGTQANKPRQVQLSARLSF